MFQKITSKQGIKNPKDQLTITALHPKADHIMAEGGLLLKRKLTRGKNLGKIFTWGLWACVQLNFCQCQRDRDQGEKRFYCWRKKSLLFGLNIKKTMCSATNENRPKISRCLTDCVVPWHWYLCWGGEIRGDTRMLKNNVKKHRRSLRGDGNKSKGNTQNLTKIQYKFWISKHIKIQHVLTLIRRIWRFLIKMKHCVTGCCLDESIESNKNRFVQEKSSKNGGHVIIISNPFGQK